jgi:hypothetical protein
MPYASLLKSFAVRLCVAVTLGVLLLAAVEFYAYKRYLPVGDPLEPAVKLDMAATGNAAEREYWNEFIQANKVGYRQFVLWRRLPYSGELLTIDREGVRRTLHTRCNDMTRLLPFGCSAIRSCGERVRPTPTPSPL